MPLISIITPTQAHNADHIATVWDCLVGQTLPAGWEFEWLVQEDGSSRTVRDLLPRDDRVCHDALGIQIGSAACRNHALARAKGDIIAGMDHDDFYEPGGLARLLQPLIDRAGARHHIDWSCGRSQLLMEDGTTWTKEDVLPPGLVEARSVTDHYLATNDFPFPAAFTAFRRQQLIAHGGWPAVARSADAILLASFSDEHHGWWVADTVAVYRRWARQKTVQPGDFAIRDLPHVRGMIGQRRAAQDLVDAT
ncbi:MAG: glycosyltransferase family 2 protein [Euzebya sp.]